jgi:hypothetical protein
MSLLPGRLLWLPLVVFSTHAFSEPLFHPVPKASCGPQDRTESVQGQTTFAERFAPGPSKAYNCNLELVGQYEGEGASFGYADFKQCAYYSAAMNSALKSRGVTVLDVSDTARPQATTHLNTPVMLDAIETLEVSTAGELLLASSTAQTPGLKSPFQLELYDLSQDCRRPTLKSTLPLPDNMYAHTGQFTADGRTYYGAKWPPDAKFPPIAAVFAVDVQKVFAPQYLGAWVPSDENWITHHVALNAAGTRAYVAIKRLYDDAAKSPHLNGLVILDVSEIQARKPNPKFRFISRLFWDDTHLAQFTLPVWIGGKPFVIFSDLVGALGTARPVPTSACTSGRPNHGFARIIDIADEKNPRIVSKLLLEVHDPANCQKVMHDPTSALGYGSSGCSVDNKDNARLLACSYFESGLRVFDIRNPAQPRELAYYKPPARRTENRPASMLRLAPGVDFTADPLVVLPRFHHGGQEIWFTSFDNGFQVVRLSDRFKATHPELF